VQPAADRGQRLPAPRAQEVVARVLERESGVGWHGGPSLPPPDVAGQTIP
jgi:hypothetical protein